MLVLGDESQDLNAVQHWLLLNAGERVVFVGDSHQAIYGWRGASQDSMNLLERELKKLGPVVQANLTYTRRCPKSVVALAQRLVPHIQALPASIEGEVRTQDKLVERDRETGAVGRRPELGSMVLCRTNAPLVEHAFALWKLGTPAFIKGKSTQKEVLDLVHRSEAGSINETLANAQRVVTEDVSRLLALEEGRGEVRASRLMDILECLDGAAKAVQPATDTWQLKEALNKLFGEGKPSHEVVVLSTVHRAKGLEADSVYVVGPELIPHKGAKKPWELDGERNVLYVAETRAKKELVFVGGRPKWAAQQ
jgi:superfamily I DNA/RNA helicase